MATSSSNNIFNFILEVDPKYGLTKMLKSRLIETIISGQQNSCTHTKQEVLRLLVEGSESSSDARQDPGQYWKSICEALLSTRAATHHSTTIPDIRCAATQVLRDDSRAHQVFAHPQIETYEDCMSIANPSFSQAPLSSKQVLYYQLHLFKTSKCLSSVPYHKGFIKCYDVKCAYCRAVFSNVQITPCKKYHKGVCVPMGWFPHVGISLWKKLQAAHDSKAVFVRKSHHRVYSYENLRVDALVSNRERGELEPDVVVDARPESPTYRPTSPSYQPFSPEAERQEQE